MTALQPRETENIHCILTGALVYERTWGWIWNSSENSVPPGAVPINTVETESAVLLDFVCLLCSFWPMSSRFFSSCISYVEFRMGFVMWSICVITGDTICQCGTRGRIKPLGSDTVGKRKRERESVCGGVGWQSAAVWESHRELSQSAEQERASVLGKRWDSFCVCDANRSSHTEGEEWDVGKIALTDRTGWWAHLSSFFLVSSDLAKQWVFSRLDKVWFASFSSNP